jgi:hypothetical protein
MYHQKNEELIFDLLIDICFLDAYTRLPPPHVHTGGKVQLDASILFKCAKCVSSGPYSH